MPDLACLFVDQKHSKKTCLTPARGPPEHLVLGAGWRQASRVNVPSQAWNCPTDPGSKCMQMQPSSACSGTCRPFKTSTLPTTCPVSGPECWSTNLRQQSLDLGSNLRRPLRVSFQLGGLKRMWCCMTADGKARQAQLTRAFAVREQSLLDVDKNKKGDVHSGN